MQGVICHQTGRHEEALENFGRATRLDGRKPAYFNNRGATFQALGRWNEALDSFQQAVTLQPKYADAHGNLGYVYEHLGDVHQADKSYRAALQCDRNHLDSLLRLARLLLRLNRLREASGFFQRALKVRPDQPAALAEFAECWLGLGRPQDAEPLLRRALQLNPNDPVTQFNLGNALNGQGLTQQARDAYQQASALVPRCKAWSLRSLVVCPPAFENVEQLDSFRDEFEHQLDRLIDDPPKVTPQDLLEIGFVPPFELAYHGRCSRRIKEKFASLFRKWIQPRVPQLRKSGKPRVGFVVTRGHEGVFLRCSGGIIERLDPKELDVVLICTEGAAEKLREGIQSPDITIVSIPENISAAADRIEAAKCDLLYFWEIGSDPLNYLLPFYRLAPIQVTSWGTQVTTGMKEIDYYVSSELIELPTADEHYTEKLVRLPGLLTFQQRLATPATATKATFGLDERKNVYLCPQSVLKLHPEQDQLFAEILRNDPKGVVVLKSSRQPRPVQIVMERLKRVAPDVADRIVVLPWQSQQDYCRLITVADAILDTLHFGAGSSSYDMWSLNQPIVSLPGSFNVGRYTQACYRKMDWMDLVAKSTEQYVTTANRLGKDSDWRMKMRQQVAERSHVLFEQASSVAELESFLLRAIELSRSRI